MKMKKARSLFLMLAAVFLLSGCGAADSVKQEIRSFLVEKQAEIYGEQFEAVSEEDRNLIKEQVRPEDYQYADTLPMSAYYSNCQE